MRKIICLVVLFCVGCHSSHAANKQAATSEAVSSIFQIGQTNGDFHDLALGSNYKNYSRQFPDDVSFTVGKSDAKRDWPWIHPGPADAWAGSRTHRFRINFQLPKVGSGWYRLTIDYAATHPADPPTLAIDINAQHLEQKLPAGSNPMTIAELKPGKSFSFQQLLPPTLLHSGENSITITDTAGSWAIYDDVRLEGNLPAPEQILTVQADPLPFFKKTPEGLRRGMKVSINSLEAGDVPAELICTSGSKSSTQKLDVHFGANPEVMMLVPDVKHVELSLHAGQHQVKIPVALPPTKKWLVYIIATAHTDIGYTNLQEQVKERHASNGLQLLQWLDAYPFFKWYSETFWQLNALLELHPEKTEEVFQRLREKRWGLSADYANMLTGLCSSEALNRVTLDARNLANRGGFELNSLVLDDVPAAIGPFPMVLANSGIKYFIEGSNKDRAPYSGLDIPNPFYWEGPDGSRVLAEIVHGYGQARHVIQNAPEQLPDFLAQFQTGDYPYDAVLVNGGFGDNGLVQPWIIDAVQQWNAQWDYPKLIFAQPEDFFGYIEKNFSGKIPVLKTDFGGWWEDGAGSTALETMLSRRAENRIVTAEMLHSLAGIMTKAAYPKKEFDEVWHDILLYNEHTWGAAASVREPRGEQTVKQWQVKSGFAHDADAESRKLLDSGMAQLAAMAPKADLIVFNPLAWPRSAVVKTDRSGAVEDVQTGKAFSCQELPEGGNCFVAEDLPSIGYRSYNQAIVTRPVADAVQISGNQMENEFYRVRLNPKSGGVESIFDKQLKRELVDPDSQYNLGELIYVTGGDGTSAIHSNLDTLPRPKFEYHRQSGAKIEKIVGPVFGELDSESTAQDFPKITLGVRLYRGIKQLDLIFQLDKTETMAKEAVYLAFPFGVDASKGGLWLEYPDEITEPLRDQHSSACRDWYSVQHWLAVSDGNATVEISPLDAPLFTIGQMTASTWPTKIPFDRGHVFGYIMNNYWHTNYKASQGGAFTFRYSITSTAGGFSKQDAVMNGWNMYCPAVVTAGGTNHAPRFSLAAQSLVSVNPIGMPLTTIKEAEDGKGYILRLCDLAGVGGRAGLTLPAAVRELFECNLVETNGGVMNQKGKNVSVPVKRFGVNTVRGEFER